MRERAAIWTAMADQFLDTETRPGVPRVALLCVQGGLSPEEASRVWRFEVAPVVAFNLWDVAGEWAGWDPSWLLPRIQERARERSARPDWVAHGLYRLSVQGAHANWVAIERCMEALLAAPDPGQLAADLGRLAEVWFDFGVGAHPPTMEPSCTRRLAAVFAELFPRVFSRLTAADERADAARRVAALLAGPLSPASP